MLIRKLIAIYWDSHMTYKYAMWQHVDLLSVTVDGNVLQIVNLYYAFIKPRALT